MEKRTIGQLLNERTNKDAEPEGVVKPVNLGQGQQVQAAGNATEAAYNKALDNIFQISDALEKPGQILLTDFMQRLQPYVQEQKAKAGTEISSTATGKPALSTQFDNSNKPAAPAQTAGNVAPSTGPSGPSH